MAGIVNMQNYASDLLPEISEYIGMKYNDFELEYPKFMEIRKSDRPFDIFTKDGGLGLASPRADGDDSKMDTMQEHWEYRTNPTVYSNGFTATERAVRYGMSNHLMRSKGGKLAKSLRDTKEIACANVPNRAFNTAYTYGDGKAICVTDHPLQVGTNSNAMATPVAFGENAWEQALRDLDLITNERGLKIYVKPRGVIMKSGYHYDALRLFGSIDRPFEQSNTTNVHKGESNVIPLQYLDSTTEWFVQTNVPDGLVLFEHQAIKMSSDNAFLSDNILIKATMEFAPEVLDSMGLYGVEAA